MAGRGEHLDARPAAADGRPSVHRGEVGVEDAAHHRVGAVVVVAVLRRLVDEAQPQVLAPREVGVERGDELRQRRVSPFVDRLVQRGEAVGDRADPDRLDVAVVVARAAGVVVEAAGHAVVGDRGEERRRHLPRVDPLDQLVPRELDLDQARELRAEGAEEGLEVAERLRPAGRRAEPPAAPRIDAVVQRQLEDLRQVEVAGEDVRLLAEGAGLDAAGAAALPRVLDRLPHPQLLLDHRVGVEDRGEAVAAAHDLQRAQQQRVGRLARELEVAARLEEVHLLDHVEQQVRDRVRAVLAGAQQPAEVDVGEVGVGAALLRRHADLGRRGVVVELDEEALEELARRLLGQRAVLEPPAVERPEMLVEVAGAEGVPAVEFGDHAEVAEPVGLQRLVEVARRLGRHAAADVGDLQQLGAPPRVGRLRRAALRQRGVPLGEEDRRPAGDVHRPQLLPLVVGQGVGAEVERGERGGDVALHGAQAASVDLAVEHGVPRRALLHELGEDAALVGRVPLRGQLGEDPVAQRAAAPVGDHDLLVGAEDVVRHAVGGLGARVEDPQVVEAVAGQLGEGRHELRRRAALADDQLVVAEVDRLAPAEPLVGQGAEQRRGAAPRLLAVELRRQERPLGADRRDGGEARRAQPVGAVVHRL